MSRVAASNLEVGRWLERLQIDRTQTPKMVRGPGVVVENRSHGLELTPTTRQ